MSPFTQVVNQPYLNANGFQVAWASNTTLTVSAGIARDSTNQIDINLGNYLGLSSELSANTSVTVNAAINGANGLDTGSLANNTPYYLYLIADPSGYNQPACILSTSSTGPLMPAGQNPSAGYSVYRLIDYWFTNGSAQFIKAYNSGTSNARKKLYDAYISVLSAGAATTATLVDLSAVVPPVNNTPVLFNVSFTPATAGDSAVFVPGDSASTTGVQVSGVVASQVQRSSATVWARIVSSKPQILYTNSASSCATSLRVLGFDYSI